MWRALVCATGFLTRLPLPQVALEERDVARSAAFFSWVGALLAGLLWLTERACIGLGERVAALIVVSVWALLTGGLHLDGLADTVDGLSGGRGDRTRILEIMRDSRIGSHGATALVLALGLKWAALERLFALGIETWLVTPVIARMMCTALIWGFPYAREHGLGSPFVGRVGRGSLAISALAMAPAVAWLGASWAPSALIGAASALGLALWMHRRIEGITGDVLGAAVEVCEVAMLIALGGFGLRG